MPAGSAGHLLILVLAAWPAAAQEAPSDAAKPVQLPPVVVIGSTPVPALGTPIEKYAGNVQSISAETIDNQNLLNLSDTLYRNFGSVNINGNQGNPWQNDLTYRGFLASPLAGSPIGLSMYLDGMRFNDGFGETINWDLIPQSAIAGVDIIPGSNPIFGLNTLGGALAVHTKRGFDFPGVKLEASGGSFGRWNVNGEYGGFRGPFDWYLTFNALNENGWREQSPSDLYQLFTKAGYKTDRTDVEVSFAYANNDLTGNGLAPESLLARDRRAVYTFPDETKNLMYLGNLRGSRWLTDDLLVSGNAFYRNYQRTTRNGDVEISCVDDDTGRARLHPDRPGRAPGQLPGVVGGVRRPKGQTTRRRARAGVRGRVSQDEDLHPGLGHDAAALAPRQDLRPREPGHRRGRLRRTPVVLHPERCRGQPRPGWQQRGRAAERTLRDGGERPHRPAEHRRLRAPTPSTSPTGWRSRSADATRT